MISPQGYLAAGAFLARRSRGAVLCAVIVVFGFCPSGRAELRHGMVRIAGGEVQVGTSDRQREKLAERFDCHPTWLGDDEPQRRVKLTAYWIDRYPVTNAEYLAFVEATGRGRPAWWARWGGVFPAEYAEHPVVGVSGQDAAAYVMRFEELTLNAEFLAGEERVEQRFTAVNHTGVAGRFGSSSCFNLQNHPQFYDCEQLRTYALDAAGRFQPVRRLSRGGQCVRWITGPRAGELGSPLRWAVLAVVARDGRAVIGTARRCPGGHGSLATNTMFTCLHTDSAVEVPPEGQATTRQFFWFLDAGLDVLKQRVMAELPADQ